jgi:hypothetical protein
MYAYVGKIHAWPLMACNNFHEVACQLATERWGPKHNLRLHLLSNILRAATSMELTGYGMVFLSRMTTGL